MSYTGKAAIWQQYGSEIAAKWQRNGSKYGNEMAANMAAVWRGMRARFLACRWVYVHYMSVGLRDFYSR